MTADYRAGQQFYAGSGISTVLADMDFETFSAAGYIWTPATKKWADPKGSTKKGLPAVGAAVYARHPTCEALCFAYDLKDGRGRRRWRPGQSNPIDLFLHLARGELVEAWNVGFELWVWNSVCTRRYGWPPLNPDLVRCAMAKARAHGLPGGLDAAANVLNLDVRKVADGARLIDKFSNPRTPTKKDPRPRIRMEDDPVDAERMCDYNEQDIVVEAEASIRIPDLPPAELEYWQVHERINRRGMQIDREAVANSIVVMEAAFERYNSELAVITGGQVEAASQLERLKGWLSGRGVRMDGMDEDAIDAVLPTLAEHSPERRALEIRQRVGSAAVKKLYAFDRYADPVTGRVYDSFIFHSAHTGRSAGAGVQPQNFTNSGPNVRRCEGCRKHYGTHLTACPHCGTIEAFSEGVEWGHGPVEDAIETLRTRSLDWVEFVWGDAFPVIAGSLRGMIVAAPGHDLICSDYNSIEAVGLAMLAGEEWRIEVFRTHGKIYEMSAAKITGTPFEEYLEYKKRSGQHHPDRKKLGKVPELASGYQGWVGAWKAFGADAFFTDDQIKEKVLAWRAASPMIVALWAGLEKCAHYAVSNPGSRHTYRDTTWFMQGDALYCELPSGRRLVYHRPMLEPSDRGNGLSLSFEGWNTNPKNGPIGWIRKRTWGGKLTENCLSGDSKVLTFQGWKRLDSVQKTDRVFDGVEFVEHAGLIDQGEHECLVLDGVSMTPDHEVLTHAGWKTALEATAEGPVQLVRPEVRDADGDGPRGTSREEMALDLLVRLRGELCEVRGGRDERRSSGAGSELRLQNPRTPRGTEGHPRHVAASGVRGVEVDERPLPASHPPILGQLRGEGHYGLQTLARVFRELLGGRSRSVREGVEYRPDRQRLRVLSGQRQVGPESGSGFEPAGERPHQHPPRAHDDCRSVQGVRDRAVDHLREGAVGVARRASSGRSVLRVFDLKNCGPRHRFVVLGDNGPFIVHNCVQAICNDLLRYATVNLEKRGYSVVMHVHDELVCEVPIGHGSVEEMEAVMMERPWWALHWPVKASGGWRQPRYGK